MKNAGAGRRLLFDWDFLFQRALHRFLHSLISDLQVIGTWELLISNTGDGRGRPCKPPRSV